MGKLAIRKLMPEEAFVLMGLTEEDVAKCRAVGMSDSALYKQAGNGLITNVVQYIAEHIYKAQIDNDYITMDEKKVAEGYGVDKEEAKKR